MTTFFFIYSIFFTYGCFSINKSPKTLDMYDLKVILVLSAGTALLCAVAFHFFPPFVITIGANK